MIHPDLLRWLRETLASLPTSVTSLSVGALFSDPNDVPNIEPRMQATLADAQGVEHPYPSDGDGLEGPLAAAWEAVYALDDDLRSHVGTLTHLMPVDDWATVRRAELPAP